MPDNLFNYSFNISQESSQDAVLNAINTARLVPPVPESFFFADLGSLSVQAVPGDAFGPVDANNFRVTSKFPITTNVGAFATTDGHLFFAPHGNDPNKVNIFLKPSKPVDIGVKIKYFVYRGILRNSIFADAGGGGNLKLIDHDPTTNLPFVNRLWDEYKEFNDLTNSTNPITFSAGELGYNPSNPADLKIIRTFFKRDSAGNPSYNLARVTMGDKLGFFAAPELGFEIVVDFGDCEQETGESGFELDFAYASATECVFNLLSTNPAFVAGNLPTIPSIYTGTSPTVFKQNIYHFIDPAAFYGAHITQFGAKPHGTIHTNIQINGAGGNHKYVFYQDDVYNHIVSRFFTANNIYLYIIGKRGRSYNFYGETPSTPTTGPIQPAPTLTGTVTTYPPPEDFSTNGWPIKILDDVNNPNYFTYDTNSANDSLTTINFFLNYLLPTTGPFFNNNFYIRNAFNVIRFKEFMVNATSNPPRTQLKSPYHMVDGLPIANLMYATYSNNVDYAQYYNDLIGPIDVSEIYEPQDFDTAQGHMIQWVIYNKPKMYHIANSNILGEMKVVFEGTGTDASPNTDTRTRLYIIYPTDSNDPNFIKRYPFVSGCDIVDTNNSFANLVYRNNLNINVKTDIRIWLGSVLDNGLPVGVLAVRNLVYDGDNVSNFIQVGITQQEFNRLSVGAPDNLRFNTFFEFVQVLAVTIDNYGKYQLGITYDDVAGNRVTYVNNTNPVFVYSIDGKFFTTPNYVTQFLHAETFATAAVEFLPFSMANLNNIWDGDYGFDWMRKTMQGIVNTNLRFPPFAGIMGTIPSQDDGNDPDTGTFVPDNVMYNNLKVGEYNAIPMNWRNGVNDNDIEYFSAWLSIYKGQNITLRLSIKVGSVVPSSLTIRYDKINFLLTAPGATNATDANDPQFDIISFNTSSLTPSTNIFTTTLNINYLNTQQTFAKQDQFVVMARNPNDGQERVAGLLNLFTKTRNNDLRRKIFNVNFVPVSITLPGGTAQYTQNTLTAVIPTLVTDFQRFMDHAQIDAQVNWLPQLVVNGNFTNCLDSGGMLVGNPGSLIDGSGTDQLHIYLKQRLRETPGFNNSAAAGYMTIFFINSIGGIVNDDNTTTQLGGYSSGLLSDIIVFSLAATDITTVPHEVLHSLVVPHTFDKTNDESLYVYQGRRTENIMDYVNGNPPANPPAIQSPVLSPRHSTYHWQWVLARKNVR